MKNIALLVGMANPTSRRRSLIQGLDAEHTVQHSKSVLSQFFEEGSPEVDEENTPPVGTLEAILKSEESLSTCSVSTSSSLDRANPKLVQDEFDEEDDDDYARGAVEALRVEDCHQSSPYNFGPSSSSVLTETPMTANTRDEDRTSTSSMTESTSSTVRLTDRLSRGKSRLGLQTLFKRKSAMRRSQNEEDLSFASLESLQRAVLEMEAKVLLEERNLLAALRSEQERLEMRLLLLRKDVETRYALADSLPKQLQNPPHLQFSSMKRVVPRVVVSRARQLEEAIMREWSLLPPPTMKKFCKGSLVRDWVGGQALQMHGAFSNQVVMLCVLQWLSADDVNNVKQTCRTWYNVCSQYFRAKPVCDLAVELLNSEAVYNAYLESFLRDFRDVLVQRDVCASSDVTAVFRPVEMIYQQSSHVLRVLQDALELDRPSKSEVGGEFVKLTREFERQYASYCEAYPEARAAGERILASKGVLDVLGRDTTSLTLDSFMIMPVQRVPRYLLMLQSMLRKTPSPKHANHEPLMLATELLQQCTSNINMRMQEAEDKSKLEKTLKMIADCPPLGCSDGIRVLSHNVVTLHNMGSKPVLALLLSDRIILATKGSKSGPAWRFRSQHSLQNCHARMFDDPRAPRVQLLTDEGTFVMTFEAEEVARTWLSQFSSSLLDRLKYHPRPVKFEKVASPKMVLIRFSEMDGQVLTRPVVAKVSSVSLYHTFVLDTDSKIFVFAGKFATANELSTAEQYVEMVTMGSDTRSLSVEHVSELDTDSEFFAILGGDASLVGIEKTLVVAPPHLSVFQDSVAYPRPSTFTFSVLPIDSGCALIEARYGPVFVWAAIHSSPTLRDRAIRFAQESFPDRFVEFVLAGCEPPLFKMLFLDWPGMNMEAIQATPLAASDEKGTIRRKRKVAFGKRPQTIGRK